MSNSTPSSTPKPLKTSAKSGEITPGATPKQLKTPTKQDAKTQNTVSFIIDQSNVQKLLNENVMISKLLKNETVLHKFIIQNTAVTSPKADIVKAVVNQAKPQKLVPIKINSINNKVEFFCYGSGGAIHKLSKDNLMLNFNYRKPTPSSSKKENSIIETPVQLPMTVIVGFGVVGNYNLHKILPPIFKTRLSTNGPLTANLSHFEKLPGMFRDVYIDITVPQMINLVLTILKPFKPSIIKLSHNNITQFKCKYAIQGVLSLDLSHNQIKTLADIRAVSQLKQLQEINLIGNPVCDEFQINRHSYVEKIKEILPNIKILDMVPINRKQNKKKADNVTPPVAAEYFIDQFMEHYFTFYDNPRTRKHLQEMYHSKAIFSLSSSIVDKKDEVSQWGQRYKHHAHNLFDSTTIREFSVGPTEIIKKNSYLPPLQHDPYTFSVDVLHFVENKLIIFTIHGIFRETANPLVLYSFSRTFMLLAGENGEYKITNDLLFVSNNHLRLLQHVRTPFQDEAAYTERMELNGSLKYPDNNKQGGQDCCTAILIELTGLHVDCARSLLQKSKWNMQETLANFIHGLRFGLIHQDHFLQEEIRFIVNSQLQVKPGMDTKKIANVLKNLKILKDQGKLVKPANLSKEEWNLMKSELKMLLNKTYSRVEMNNPAGTSRTRRGTRSGRKTLVNVLV